MDASKPKQCLTPIDPYQFECITDTFEELLRAAEGVQELGRVLTNLYEHQISSGIDTQTATGYAVRSLGKHIQDLRNKAAEELQPIFKGFGERPIGY